MINYDLKDSLNKKVEEAGVPKCRWGWDLDKVFNYETHEFDYFPETIFWDIVKEEMKKNDVRFRKIHYSPLHSRDYEEYSYLDKENKFYIISPVRTLYVSEPHSEEKIELLREMGFQCTYIGHSSISYRNWYEIHTQLPDQTGMCLNFSEWKDCYEIGSVWECKTIPADATDVDEALKVIEPLVEAKITEGQRKLLEIGISVNGDHSLVNDDGKHHIEESRFPEWKKIWEARVSLTKDKRDNRDHKYLQLWIKPEEVKGKRVYLQLPDNFKGLFIGKAGSNIKALQERWECKFIVK